MRSICITYVHAATYTPRRSGRGSVTFCLTIGWVIICSFWLLIVRLTQRIVVNSDWLCLWDWSLGWTLSGDNIEWCQDIISFICRLTMCGSYISNRTINITLYRRVTTEEAIDLSQGRCCHSDLNTWQNYTNNNAVPLMNILTRSQPTLHQLSQKGRHDVLQALPIKSNQVTNSSKLCSPS